MEDLTEDKLTEIVIDFSDLDGSEQAVNEFLGSGPATLGANIKLILQRMFGMNSVPVTIRGSESQVGSFANALGAEKRYIDVARRLGLTDPRAMRSRSKAQAAARAFKRETGIDWPFK